MKQTKKSFALSLVSLILCFSMLLGSTWAWFTDSVTSTGNVIKSGTLDVTFEWMEGNLDPSDKDSSDWMDASTGTIFNSELWEPGYTEVKHIKIENEGSLALKYVLDIIPYDEYGNVLSVDGLEVDGVNLAKAIDVYYLDPAMQIATRDDLVGISPMCTLYDALKGLSVTGNGTLLSGDLETITLALKMQETAGNEYQDKSIGASFAIRLMATQYTKEADSFDENYDTDSKWPIDTSFENDSVSADVTPTVDNKVAAGGVSLTSTSGKISANIPEGVLLADNTSKVTLSVSDVAQSEANITLSETEATLSVDVHIEGISENNDTVIAVDIDELLPVGLNMGNYRFYHVENGATVEMTLLENGVAPVHNNYAYDPTTGDVTLYLKSFSEVAVVADTENAWEGEFDYDWYNADETEYTIANADQLAAFGAIVGGMAEDFEISDFAGKTVKLIADVNLGDAESDNAEDIIFYPIGYHNSTGSYDKISGGEVTSSVSSFEGTFDGNGHTIANFYQNTWEMFGDYNSGYSGTPNHYKDAMGLFGYVYNGTVKNLTVDNFSSDGEFTPTGVIAAYASNSTFENIAITNCNPRVYNTGNGGIVGIGGNSSDTDSFNLNFKNITIDNTNKITALWGSWDVACGGLVGMFRGAGHVNMDSCHVAAQIDAYNDVCGNYQYYWYRYSGMLIGTNQTMIEVDGYTVPETDKYHAENCTVHFDKWNDYYYCEMVVNSIASYTHDHQFSRLEQVKSVDVANLQYVTLDGETKNISNSGRYNFVVLNGGFETEYATCYHFVDGSVWNHEDAGYETVDGVEVLKEDKQHIYLPFNQLFTGYGWGVKHIPVGAFNGVTILEREVADSQTKFTVKYDNNTYRIGDGCTITVGDLFEAINGMSINNSGVFVSVEALDNTKPVVGSFDANATDWRNSTLTVNGTGAVKLTIQDYDYCTPTSLIITVDSVAVGNDGVSNKILGLSKIKAYEYAPVTILEESTWTWTDVPAGSSEFEFETAGLYAIRVKGATDFEYILVGQTAMDDSGYIDSADNLKNVNVSAQNSGWVIDSWSSGVAAFDNELKRVKGSSSVERAGLQINNISIPYDSEEMLYLAQNKFDFKYANPTENIIPIERLNTIKFGFNINQNVFFQHLWEDKDYTEYIATVRIHVADSDVENGYYEVASVWGGSSAISKVSTINVQTALNAKYDNPHGYVTGISILPWGGTPSDWVVQDKYKDPDNDGAEGDTEWGTSRSTCYFKVYIHGITTTSDTSTISLNVTGDAYDGIYEITGFDSNLNYVVSTDLINFKSIGSGVTSYEVSDVGTYYFKKVSNDGATESPISTFVVSGSKPAVTELNVTDGKAIGFNSDETYEWTKYTYAGYEEWTRIEKGITELKLTPGLTAVRTVAEGSYAASEPQFLYVEGDKVGSIGLEHNMWSQKVTKGTWTGTMSWNPIAYDLSNNRSYGLQAQLSSNLDSVQDYYYNYSLTDDEIISAQLVGSISMRINPSLPFDKGGVKGIVRFHIAGGVNDYYDVKFTTPVVPDNVTVNLASVLPSEEDGYLTGISIWPIYEISSNKMPTSSFYLILRFIGVEQVADWQPTNTNADNTDGKRCRLDITK